MTIELIHGDCLEVLKEMEHNSIDLICADPPYGITNCRWDSVIDLELMWKLLALLRKERTAVVLFGTEPFSSRLRMSNIANFKYDWIWNKKLAGNGILAKKQPLKIHEIVSVFYKHDYMPIKTKGKMRKKLVLHLTAPEIYGETTPTETRNDLYYPKSIIEFSMAGYRKNSFHPTQKNTKLMEYLISTYSKPGDTVLDFCMGSGTTGIAAKKLNRNFIGIELKKKYFDIAKKRINDTQLEAFNICQ